jgi:hypothetical protein
MAIGRPGAAARQGPPRHGEGDAERKRADRGDHADRAPPSGGGRDRDERHGSDPGDPEENRRDAATPPERR